MAASKMNTSLGYLIGRISWLKCFRFPFITATLMLRLTYISNTASLTVASGQIKIHHACCVQMKKMQ